MANDNHQNMDHTRIAPRPITADSFAPYGRVARLKDEEPLAETDQFRYWSDHAHYEISGETEIGYCTVKSPQGGTVRWMERHEKTPEILIPIDAPVVLPVMANDRVEAFVVQPGEAAVLNANAWHSACLPQKTKEASYFVIFRRGTPGDDVEKQDIETVRIAGSEGTRP